MTLTDTHDPLHKTTEDLVTEAPLIDDGAPVLDRHVTEIPPYEQATEVDLSYVNAEADDGNVVFQVTA